MAKGAAQRRKAVLKSTVERIFNEFQEKKEGETFMEMNTFVEERRQNHLFVLIEDEEQ